jgi:hypothetical protein
LPISRQALGLPPFLAKNQFSKTAAQAAIQHIVAPVQSLGLCAWRVTVKEAKRDVCNR